MRASLLLLAILFFPHDAQAKKNLNGIDWQWYGQYMRESVSFTTTGTGDANFKGSQMGAGTQLKISANERYGFAVKGAFSSRKGENTANGTVTRLGFTETESLSGSIFDMGVRFYAIDVFLGVGVSYMPFTINYSTTNPSSTAATTRKYSGFGVNLELGVDLFLGTSSMFVSPKVEYRTYSAQPSTGAANAERMSNFGFGVGLGLSF